MWLLLFIGRLDLLPSKKSKQNIQIIICSKVMAFFRNCDSYQFTGSGKQCDDVTDDLMTSLQKILCYLVDFVEDYNCAKFNSLAFVA